MKELLTALKPFTKPAQLAALLLAIPVTVVALQGAKDVREFAAGYSIDIKANRTDGPLQVPINTQVTISWSSTAQARCQGLNNLAGLASFPSGSVQVTNNSYATKTYTIRCYESLLPDSPYFEDSVQVTYSMAPSVPTGAYSRMYGNGYDDQVTVVRGSVMEFNWRFASVTNCMLSNGDAGFGGRAVTSAGSELRTVSESRLYSISCYDPARRTSYLDHVTVYVVNPTPTPTRIAVPTPLPTSVQTTPRPPTPTSQVSFPTPTSASSLPVSVDLRANGTDILWVNVNSSIVLSWNALNATSCVASGGWTGNRAVSGTETLYNVTNTIVIYLTCSNAGNVSTDSVTIYVNPSNGCDPRARGACGTPTPPLYYTPTPTSSICPRGRC